MATSAATAPAGQTNWITIAGVVAALMVGTVALMAALAYLKKDMDILHREEMESEVMRVLSRNGMIDMTGSLLPGVDGFDTRMNVGIVSMMRQCTAYAVRYSHNSDHWFGPVLAKKFFEQA